MLPRTGRRGLPEAPDYVVMRGQVDIALCSVLSDAGLLRSEAAALTWADVEIATDGSGRIRIARTKTDQEGEIVAITASTVQALEAIRNGAGDDSSVFDMSESTIGRRVKAAAAAAGLGEQFSGHSGRVGLGATHDRGRRTRPGRHGAGEMEERRHRSPLHKGDLGRHRPAMALAALNVP